MSRGPGIIQRRLAAALEAKQGAWWSVEELAASCYPGETIERKHCESVRRAVGSVSGLQRRTLPLDKGAGHKVVYKLVPSA